MFHHRFILFTMSRVFCIAANYPAAIDFVVVNYNSLCLFVCLFGCWFFLVNLFPLCVVIIAGIQQKGSYLLFFIFGFSLLLGRRMKNQQN